MWRVFLQQSRTFGPVYQRMSKHPSWVPRTAISITLLTIIIPLILIILIGLLVGFIVFNVLALVATVLGWIGVGDKQRDNVRVVDDELTGF